jgi:hypothetical protein
MLRDRQQVALQDIERRGRELLERYRSLSGSARNALGAQRVDEVIEARTRMLERLAERIAEHSELPTDGNRDKAHLESLSDRVLAGAGAEATLVERFGQAEAEYRGEIEHALSEEWRGSDHRILGELLEHVKRTESEWVDGAV